LNPQTNNDILHLLIFIGDFLDIYKKAGNTEWQLVIF